jgi:hypothetical protein
MSSFSYRKGLKKARTQMQVDSMDDALRNRLWNVLDFYYWSKASHAIVRIMDPYEDSDISRHMRSFLNKLWHHHFARPVDEISLQWTKVYQVLRERYFKFEWNEVYDFLEFVANNFEDKETIKKFTKTCNSVLEEEFSAYRFVGYQITQMTEEEEISEIEEALGTPSKPVRTHLKNSLKLLSDRKSPDYRNSIKESISAVEAICRLITKDKNDTLGQALKEVESKIGLHGALKKAFSNLYGYTSSADGIRHSLMDEPKLGFEDAKFMLVSCSAFVNYLTSKAEKAKIELQ